MGRFAHLLQNNVFADALSGSFVLHEPLAVHIHRELRDRHIVSSSPVVHCLQKRAPSSDRGCECPDELLVSFQPSLATQHFFQQVEGPLVDLQIIDEDDERTYDEHDEDKMMVEAHVERFVFAGDDNDRKIKDDLTVDTDDSDGATSVSSRALDHELETEEDSPLLDSEKEPLADVKANLAAEEKKKELDDKEAKELRKAALEEKIAALKAKVSQLQNTQNARHKITLAPALGPRVLPTSPFRPKKEVPRPKNGAVPLLDFSSVCFTYHDGDDSLETPGRKLTRDIEKELALIKVPICPVCPNKIARIFVLLAPFLLLLLPNYQLSYDGS
jgi:hypothetical protein